MFPAWAVSLAASLFLLAALWWVSRRLAFYFLTLAFLLTRSYEIAQAFYAILILPGTIMHELSHWLAARLVGVRTGKVSLLPQMTRDKGLRLGAVDVRGGALWQHTLIGLAPLLVGSLLTVALALRLVDVEGLRLAAQQGTWEHVAAGLRGMLATPDLAIWLYFLFTISDAMFLSASDRAPVQRMLLYFGGLLLILYLFGLAPAANAQIGLWLQRLLQAYAYGLGIALLVHLGLLFLFGSLHLLVTGRLGMPTQKTGR